MSGVIGQDLQVQSGKFGFPAGHVLQVKGVTSTTASGSSASTGTTMYLKSDGSGWQSSYTNTISLTTRKANSSFLLFARCTFFCSHSSVSGYEAYCNQKGAISTSSSSGSQTEKIIGNYYEDCRSTNNVSGQLNTLLSGHYMITTTHAAGTNLYFYYKIDYNRGYVMGDNASFIIQEIAT